MEPYAWTVVGAGPAGIAAVGRLLDHGTPDDQIGWIDPAFAAGDLGRKWRAVSSNTIAGTFLEYLNGSKAFRFSEAPPTPLKEVDPDETCALALVADPLQWVTGRLRERVKILQTTATALTLTQRRWRIETELGEVESHNVVLAVGAVPKSLSYPHLEEIPVDVALDPERLADQQLEG
ncbi:MAG: FAD/NAD(P)-binding protein, partial [Mycobacteriaceae bacterium]|nr:FAD/NAD(P)-binding protein [Mycobacteriaceae bacterium]